MRWHPFDVLFVSFRLLSLFFRLFQERKGSGKSEVTT